MASKPAQDALSKDTHANCTGGGQQLEIAWSDQITTTQAWGSLRDWPALPGKEVELGGTLVNTNGTGPGGSTQWTTTLAFMDFGPSRSGLIDFRQGLPTDVIMLGGGQAHADDPVCASAEAPNARNCVSLGAGARLALRFAGPLTGLRITARVKPGNGGGPLPMLPSVQLVAANGAAFNGNAAQGFASPVADVFALIGVPSTFNTQLDPNCGQPVTATLLVDAIEPIP